MVSLFLSLSWYWTVSSAVERLPYKQRVNGSNPLPSICNFRNYLNLIFLYIFSSIISLLLNIKYIFIMTTTLSGFVFSLVAGACVLILIAGAVIWVSSNDKLKRSLLNND